MMLSKAMLTCSRTFIVILDENCLFFPLKTPVHLVCFHMVTVHVLLLIANEA